MTECWKESDKDKPQLGRPVLLRFAPYGNVAEFFCVVPTCRDVNWFEMCVRNNGRLTHWMDIPKVEGV